MNREWRHRRRAKARLGPLEVDFLARSVAHPDGTIVTVEPKALEVLEVLVNAGGQVIERDVLIDLCWQGYPGADESLTQAISKLRSAFRAAGGDAGMIETIPKRGYRLTVEVDHQGSAADADKPLGAMSHSQPPRRRPWLFAALALAAIAAVVTFSSRQSASSDTASGKAIALASSDGGIVSPTLATAFAAALSDWSLPLVRDEQGANYRVSVDPDRKRAGIEDMTGNSLLQIVPPKRVGTEERDDYIAYRTAGTLGCALPLEEGMSDFTLEDRAAALQFCSNVTAGETWGLHLVTENLIATRPEDPLAMALHSIALSLDPGAVIAPGAGESGEDVGQRALALARASLASPQSPDMARTALVFAQAKVMPPLDFERALSVAQKPGLQARQVRWRKSLFLAETGQLREAAILARQLIASTPGSAVLRLHAAQIAQERGREGEARELLNHASLALRMEDADFMRYGVSFHALAPDEAEKAAWDFARMVGQAAPRPCDLAYIAVRRGEADVTSLGRACARQQANGTVRMLAALGEIDAAYLASEKLDEKWLGTVRFVYGPEMQRFRADPRFASLADRFGLLDYWRAGHWPDFCRTDIPRPSVCRPL